MGKINIKLNGMDTSVVPSVILEKMEYIILTIR